MRIKRAVVRDSGKAAQAARTRRSDLEMQARFPARLLRAPVLDRVFPEAGRAAVDLAGLEMVVAADQHSVGGRRARHRESMRLWGRSA